MLLELAGYAAVWAVGVGCGYVVPSVGLIRSQGLAVSGCGSAELWTHSRTAPRRGCAEVCVYVR